MGALMEACDDPYLMLALHIVTHYGLPHIRMAVEDDDWLRQRMREECYNLDFSGPFLDTIMEHLDEHKRLWLRKELKDLADALFTQLDLKLLRRRILQIVALS